MWYLKNKRSACECCIATNQLPIALPGIVEFSKQRIQAHPETWFVCRICIYQLWWFKYWEDIEYSHHRSRMNWLARLLSRSFQSLSQETSLPKTKKLVDKMSLKLIPSVCTTHHNHRMRFCSFCWKHKIRSWLSRVFCRIFRMGHQERRQQTFTLVGNLTAASDGWAVLT